MPRKTKKGTPYQQELGVLIRQHRERMGLTQKGLSQKMKVDMSDKQISRYENGGDDMHVGTYFAFVEAFGITPNELCPVYLLANAGRMPPDFASMSPGNQTMVMAIIQSLLMNPDGEITTDFNA